MFYWSLNDGTISQLTNFSSAKDKKDKPSSKADQWLENDQLAYFDILQDRKNQRDARTYRSDLLKPERPFKVSTANKRLSGLNISSDHRFVTYQLSPTSRGKGTKVPNFVTESGYLEDLRSRSKVGNPFSGSTAWITDLQNDTSYQIITEDLPGIKDKPVFMAEYHKNDTIAYEPEYKKARAVNVGNLIFSDDGKAVVNVTSRDYKDRWIASVDLGTGKLNVIDQQHDDAWIGGPQVGWFSRGTIEWIDNQTIWFKSEESGYAHVYTANVNTGKVKALTKGKWEVLNAALSRDKSKFFMTTNEVSPHEQHFYHMSATGGKRTQITSEKGGHQVTVSPDEKSLAIRYSKSNQPWELYVMKNEVGAEMTQLTESTNPAFENYNWRHPEIITFKARDGVDVPANIYKPDPAKKNGAAVIFVHGAGYLQNVHHWWPGYYREYMFHNMLADEGYTVLEIDFRASAGYGRDWRTAIYRHMGGKDLTDNIDGATHLVTAYGIDPNRIGIYGGSYGGFITLMALFNSPGTFASGAALRSVTDWAHYNHGYTAPILNTPVEDSIAYNRSSPIYHAEGLEDKLVMLHGMIDTNVQFQDVVRLSQRLIELGKKDWDLAVFPMERHGFIEASSWTDEYRRIYELFEETLRE